MSSSDAENEIRENEIRRLSSDVINQIAAGEVIERPASVVKELVENACDAGARRIDVELRRGGIDSIVVTDDGAGMGRSNLLLSVERHATSKLRSADDLLDIRTLGFRGEALSSIASISRMKITTRRSQDDAGLRLTIEAGEVLHVEEVGVPIGTTIEVSDLFFNTPARRKFLRSPATEQSHCSQATLRVALGREEGSFVVKSGGRRILDIPEGKGRERVALAFAGRANSLLSLDGKTDGIRVSGFISPPSIQRSDSKSLFFFVNGRYVQDRMLQRALLDTYRAFGEGGRYPLGAIYLELHPATVDVNVHPRKLEVRFSDTSVVFRALGSAVARALSDAPGLPGAFESPFEGEPAAIKTRIKSEVERYFERATSMPSGKQPDRSRDRYSSYHSNSMADSTANSHSSSAGPDLSGQSSGEPELFGLFPNRSDAEWEIKTLLLSRFLIIQREGDILLADLVEARRVHLLTKLQKWRKEGARKQNLLFPVIIELGDAEIRLLEKHQSHLDGIGVSVEAIGPRRYALRTMPDLRFLNEGQGGAELLRKILTLINPQSAALSVEDLEQKLFELMASHGADFETPPFDQEEVSELSRHLKRELGAGRSPAGCRILNAADLENLLS
ncbi:DNA mismatch repair endonuclease MutL [Myxococcota bacterium]|nr:DNA mismatch repair endonuclease MutL [Myxococcota bacterium]